MSRQITAKLFRPAGVAEKLQTPPGEEVWKVERVRKIGDRFAMYSLDYFPASLVPPGVKNNSKTIYSPSIISCAKYAVRTSDQGSCTLKPILADEKLAEIMKVPRNTPFMLVETIDLNPEQKPISYAREYYLADLFEFPGKSAKRRLRSVNFLVHYSLFPIHHHKEVP